MVTCSACNRSLPTGRWRHVQGRPGFQGFHHAALQHPSPRWYGRDVPIGATDLDSAFEQYRRYWWNPLTTGAVGVWHNHALVARVLPVFDSDTALNRLELET
jgi:hypothetical protein